ncbi:MAG: hypothetical protein WBF71_02125 [Microthrixaceae bacterium]
MVATTTIWPNKTWSALPVNIIGTPAAFGRTGSSQLGRFPRSRVVDASVLAPVLADAGSCSTGSVTGFAANADRLLDNFPGLRCAIQILWPLPALPVLFKS